MYQRWFEASLRAKLARPFVHLLFGARQTGKSTLLNRLVPPDALRINLADPLERSRHLANPGEFAQACRALSPGKSPRFVFVDEAQAVPAVFDAVQALYDADKGRWRFVLCGSSARRLRVTGANLLPGRCLMHRLYPLTLAEQPAPEGRGVVEGSPLPFPAAGDTAAGSLFPAWDLPTRLAFGALPGVVTAEAGDRPALLRSYALVHLEEEIRRETLLRDWGAFVRFLQLAASESGNLMNFAGIAQEAGISNMTVKAHYQLLEDMFVGLRVPAYAKSPRKNLLSTPKFLFFDLGIRHAAAGLNPSEDTVMANPGPVFEQWVGIELWNRLRYLGDGNLFHLRSRDGAEVDYIIERGGRLTPLEVKWTEHPTLSHARHLLAFMDEKPGEADHGYVVCRCPRPLRLHDRVTALPWWCL